VGGELPPLPGRHGILRLKGDLGFPGSPLGIHTPDVFEVILIAGQVLVLEVVADGIETVLALGISLRGALLGDLVSVETMAHRLTHFVARQTGSHGPKEEFVIVERVHGDIALLKGRV
jgi:hypothetical protein